MKVILCESLWGNEEMKNDEKMFKFNYPELEYDKNNITDTQLINYADFLNNKYKLKTKEEQPNEEALELENKEIR